MPIYEVFEGDILNDNAEIVVIPANMTGFLGDGLGLEWVRRNPKTAQVFRSWINNPHNNINMAAGGAVKLANVDRLTNPYHTAQAYFLLAITSDKYKQIATFETVENAVANCRNLIEELSNTIHPWTNFQIAIPALGCGSSGLKYDEVLYPLVQRYFLDYKEEVRLYAPVGVKSRKEQVEENA